MEGLTGYTFRNVHHRLYDGVSEYFTPFIAIRQTRKWKTREIKDIDPINNQGVTVVPQLLTNNADDFIWAARNLAGMGYAEVNLNLGCPSATVVTKHKGAGFLEDPGALDMFFENIRSNDYLYVDKTEYVWKLANSSKSFLLSRPRRFGKSLFTSTLECYFSGKKDLFKGLYIYDQENAKGDEAWVEYPIISFYLSGGEYQNPDGLELTLDETLSAFEDKYDIKPGKYDLANRFKRAIRAVHKKTRREVVVLVDEYDKPLLDTMYSNPEQEEKNRVLYKSFFSVLKDVDGDLRFVFFTGVTKFTKVSIFSDLNQLTDISLAMDYAGICGITQEELEENFQPEIAALADAEGMSHDECMAELKKMYDGYHFSRNSVGVYNPYSLLNAFTMREFGRYWFGSGTPEILIKKLHASQMPLYSLSDGVTANESALRDYRVEDKDPIPLYYQTGYLTICGYDKRFRRYTLRFPNDEVKYGFLDSLVNDVLGYRTEENPLALDNMILDLESGDLDSFFRRLTALFATIPYPEGKAPSYEGEWSRQLYLVLALMGAYTQCEIHMATGRADCVVKTPGYIYVFEFKLDKPVEDAMAQIDDKGYTIPYQSDSRKLFKVGVVFSTEKRNVVDWKIKEQG